MDFDISTFADIVLNKVKDFAPKLIGGVLLLVVGLWISKKLSKLVRHSLERSSLSPEISSFLISMLDVVLKGVVILIAAGIAGFDTSALVGVLAAAGFAVGLALQGGLGNFASGIIILIFKPYRVGDWIDLDGKFGKVEEIQIFNTILGTPGNKTLIIPNGQVTEKVVTNFSKKGSIRLELKVNIPYEQSFTKVEAIIQELMRSNPKILQEPEPQVGLEQYDTHFVVMGVKPFVTPDDYWDVTYQLNRDIKRAFSLNGIQVAYSDGIELGNIGE